MLPDDVQASLFSKRFLVSFCLVVSTFAVTSVQDAMCADKEVFEEQLLFHLCLCHCTCLCVCAQDAVEILLRGEPLPVPDKVPCYQLLGVVDICSLTSFPCLFQGLGDASSK